MTIFPLFVLPKIEALPDFKFSLQRGFKTLKYLISQNEKENQKTDIVNM